MRDKATGRFTRNAVCKDSRMAGLVRRYHTWPVHHTQTVAEHTWQVMRLWCETFGNPRSEVWYYLLIHDLGEVTTGDLPYPIKLNNPKLKAEMDRLELDALNNMGFPDPRRVLTEEEYAQFKFCDLLECAEYAQREVRMGNRFCEPFEDQSKGLSVLMSLMTDHNRQLARNYCRNHAIILSPEELTSGAA